MPFGLHMETPVPNITSRASAEFIVQNMKESRSASLTLSHFTALGGICFVSTAQILFKRSGAERVVKNAGITTGESYTRRWDK